MKIQSPQKTKRLQKRIPLKARYNGRLQAGIRTYLKETYEIELPQFYTEYKKPDVKAKLFKHETHGKELQNHLHELCKFYYQLGVKGQ